MSGADRGPDNLVRRRLRRPFSGSGSSHTADGSLKTMTARVPVRHSHSRAGQLHGAERAQAWQQINAASPQFARFQRKTDWELPAGLGGGVTVRVVAELAEQTGTGNRA